MTIKVLVPDMPTAEDLLPYLQLIDKKRIYSNIGPMVTELQQTLSEKIVGAPTVAVSNGTLAIELALRSLYLRAGTPVLCPAFTFVATGQAIANAGLSPFFCDVDLSAAWQMTPEIAARAIHDSHLHVGAVVPVAPFGVPVDVEAWSAFSVEMGIPVVIDAAGALTTQKISKDPWVIAAYSLHATKFIGAGEGGAVSTHNEVLLRRVREMMNFGDGGTNAKMSEYHAAIALASLVRVEQKRAGSRWLRREYESALEGVGVSFQSDDCRDAVLLPVLLPEGVSASAAAAWMLADGIETKQWYRPFLDERVQFARGAWGLLTATEQLRRRYIGLPFHKMIEKSHVLTVADSLAQFVAASEHILSKEAA